MRSFSVRQALHHRDQAIADGTSGVAPASRAASHQQAPDRLVEVITSIVELLDDLYRLREDEVLRRSASTQSLRAASSQLLRLADSLDKPAAVGVPQPLAIDPFACCDRGEWVEAGR
jgi:hypothetical protein